MISSYFIEIFFSKTSYKRSDFVYLHLKAAFDLLKILLKLHTPKNSIALAVK